jgi:hypothetical protein
VNQALVSDIALAGQEVMHRGTSPATQLAYAAPLQQLGERAFVHDIQNTEKVPRLAPAYDHRSKNSQEVEAGTS